MYQGGTPTAGAPLRRFTDLLDALKHEYEVAVATAAAQAVSMPDPAHISELVLMQKTVKELEQSWQRVKGAQEEEIRRLLGILKEHNIEAGVSAVNANGVPPPLPPQQPPSLDTELTAGILTSSFSAEKRPIEAGRRPNPPTVSPHAHQHQSQSVPQQQQQSGWLSLYATQEKRLSVDLLHTLQTDHVVCSVCFSHDGHYVALGGNRCVLVFEADTGRKVCSLQDSVEREGDLYMRAVQWSRDDQLVAAGAEDHFVRVWTVQSGRLKHRLAGHSQDVYAVAFVPDGKVLVSASGDRTVRLWDVPSGECRAVLTANDPFNPGKDIGFTSLAGSLDKSIRVWSVTGSCQSEFKGLLEGHMDAVYSVALTSDSTFLASSGLDKTVRIWRRDPSHTFTLCDTVAHHKDFCLSVTISPDGRWVASSSKDRSVLLYELMQDGRLELQLTLKGHKNSVISAAFSPVLGGDGREMMLATGSGDARARMWKVEAVGV